MKKSLILFIVLFFLFSQGRAQTEKLIAFKKGTVLIYEIEDLDLRYPLTVTILNTSPDLVFSYNMGGPLEKSGMVTIRKKALQTSNKLVFNFNKPKLILKDATFLFFSKLFYGKADSINTQIYFVQNPDADTLSLPIRIGMPDSVIRLGNISREVEEIPVNGKNRELNTYSLSHTKNSKGNVVDFGESYIFRVLINSEIPLLSYAHLVSYSIVLKEIKNTNWLRYNFATNEYERVDDIED